MKKATAKLIRSHYELLSRSLEMADDQKARDSAYATFGLLVSCVICREEVEELLADSAKLRASSKALLAEGGAA